MLTVAVDRSSYGGVAVHYVLPVLWMTSCVFVSGESITAESTASILIKFCPTRKIRKYTKWVAHRGHH